MQEDLQQAPENQVQSISLFPTEINIFLDYCQIGKTKIFTFSYEQ